MAVQVILKRKAAPAAPHRCVVCCSGERLLPVDTVVVDRRRFRNPKLRVFVCEKCADRFSQAERSFGRAGFWHMFCLLGILFLLSSVVGLDSSIASLLAFGVVGVFILFRGGSDGSFIRVTVYQDGKTLVGMRNDDYAREFIALNRDAICGDANGGGLALPPGGDGGSGRQ
jgi:uncharacterized protein YlaI